MFAAPLIKPFDKIAVWSRYEGAMNAPGLMSVFGVFAALYTGLVLSYERGTPFWHSAAVSLLVLFPGVAAGSDQSTAEGYPLPRLLSTQQPVEAALTYLVHLHLSLIGPVAAAFSAQDAVSDRRRGVGSCRRGRCYVRKGKDQRGGRRCLGETAVFSIRISLLLWGAWNLP
ncbi:MAG: hypothetical protein LM566_03635 [Pyrobaculum sp.]|nr:hypothetical protein [Pyrobaculum sp.]